MFDNLMKKIQFVSFIKRNNFTFFTTLLVIAFITYIDSSLAVSLLKPFNLHSLHLVQWISDHSTFFISLSSLFLFYELSIFVLYFLSLKTNCYYFELKRIAEPLPLIYCYFLLLIQILNNLNLLDISIFSLSKYYLDSGPSTNYLLALAYSMNCILFIFIIIGYFYQERTVDL